MLLCVLPLIYGSYNKYKAKITLDVEQPRNIYNSGGLGPPHKRLAHIKHLKLQQ